MRTFVGLADVLVDKKWKREIHVFSFVQLFESNSECAMLNQDKNTFLKKCSLGSLNPENPYLFDNQDLFLLKSTFREDFRVSGAKHEFINGVYELCTFSDSAENSRYRMNPHFLALVVLIVVVLHLIQKFNRQEVWISRLCIMRISAG
jgi:hypothetical protein